MTERKPAPKQRKPKSRAWVWWVLAIAIVGGIGYWAWPRYLRGYLVHSSGETMEIGSMRTICTANVAYEYGHPKQGYARTLADLGPKDGNYIDAALASGEKSGYRYEYVSRPEPSGIIEHYRVTARPRVHEAGQRSFYMDENCEIRWTREDRAATAADPKL